MDVLHVSLGVALRAEGLGTEVAGKHFAPRILREESTICSNIHNGFRRH